MDEQLFHAMYANDAANAKALYETMTTDQLIGLQAAHEKDLAAAASAEGIAFGGGRLALIAAVLKTRPPSITPSVQ